MGFAYSLIIVASIMSLDLDTRLELIKLYYANQECVVSTLRAYKQRHELRNDPFPLSTITRLVHKFENTKSLHDIPKSGRPSLFKDREEVIVESLQSIQSTSHLGVASSSSISHDTGIPARSVRRYLREYLGMYPYHLTVTQEITESDKVKRVEFAQWLLQNPQLMPHILWSDEAYFSLNGVVNKHNCIIWAFENPRRSISESLHSPQVCVWMAVSMDYKLKPFFFPSTVTGASYLDMLQNHVIPQLQRKRKMSSVIFQHDGAPPHFSSGVRSFLSEKFPEDRVIGRGFGEAWPPRSPDLTPMDFWFWGTLKARVYHNWKPTSLEELQAKIEHEIEHVTKQELENAISHLTFRLELIIENNGELIEPLV